MFDDEQEHEDFVMDLIAEQDLTAKALDMALKALKKLSDASEEIAHSNVMI
jgi:hypothetical protein